MQQCQGHFHASWATFKDVLWLGNCWLGRCGRAAGWRAGAQGSQLLPLPLSAASARELQQGIGIQPNTYTMLPPSDKHKKAGGPEGR